MRGTVNILTPWGVNFHFIDNNPLVGLHELDNWKLTECLTCSCMSTSACLDQYSPTTLSLCQRVHMHQYKPSHWKMYKTFYFRNKKEKKQVRMLMSPFLTVFFLQTIFLLFSVLLISRGVFCLFCFLTHKRNCHQLLWYIYGFKIKQEKQMLKRSNFAIHR